MGANKVEIDPEFAHLGYRPELRAVPARNDIRRLLTPSSHLAARSQAPRRAAISPTRPPVRRVGRPPRLA